MENTNIKVNKETTNIFLKSLSGKETELSIIVSPLNDIYMFDQNKIEEYREMLLKIAKLIENLDKGILFEEMYNLKDGTKWAKSPKQIEYLTALLDAANIIKYVDDEEKGLAKIKLKEHKFYRPIKEEQ